MVNPHIFNTLHCIEVYGWIETNIYTYYSHIYQDMLEKYRKTTICFEFIEITTKSIQYYIILQNYRILFTMVFVRDKNVSSQFEKRV